MLINGEDRNMEEPKEPKEPKELKESKKTAKTTKLTKSKKRIYISFALVTVVLIFFIMSCRKVEPILEITPEELNFSRDDITKEFFIKNSGDDSGIFKSGIKPLKYKVQVDSKYKWIFIDTVKGESEGERNSIGVEINRTNLKPGQNTGKINVVSNGGTKSINVHVDKKEEKITILSPSPKANLPIGQDVKIAWSATSGVGDTVNIGLYLNGSKVGNIAANYKLKSKTVGQYSFLWKVGGKWLSAGNNFAIRIEDSRRAATFGEVYPVTITSKINELCVKNISTDHQKPNTVQFMFSLRDQHDHALFIDTKNTDFKGLRIAENRIEIDYLESHSFLFSQSDFPLQAMMVLDFSESMFEEKNDVKMIVEGTKKLIDSLNDTHQIGVIEFHRPDKAPAIIQKFTTYKKAAKDSLDRFLTNKIYRDFSTCWDAVLKGLKQFPVDSNPDIFKTILLVSDGFDNSSLSKPEELIAVAKERDVHIYTLGVGMVHDENVLKGIAEETGGTYIHAEDINVLLKRFSMMTKDILGQYKISYVTPKKIEDGNFDVYISIIHNGIISSPALEDNIDPSTITEKTIRGVINFTTPTIIEDEKAEIFMWCEHSPRYINEFHFKIKTDKPYKVLLTKAKDGGICEDWTIEDEGEGSFRLKSPNQAEPHFDLDFGDFGTICKIVVDSVTENKLVIPFELDNSIYKMGQSFYGGGKPVVGQQGAWNKSIIVNCNN